MTEAVHAPALTALAGVRHAFFTRRGGVSEGVYASLNTGAGSRDDAEAVVENRRRAAEALGAEPEALLTAYQVHSAVVHVVAAPWAERPQGDGVATAAPGLVCGALSADCAPILMADAQARVVAAVHAGWKGALAGVAEAGVAAMTTLGAQPERIVAAVGPCIGPASYEVAEAFADAFVAESSAFGRFFGPGAAPGKLMFDLPAYVLSRLERAGVRGAAWTGHDTYADDARFFSNRRALHRGEGDYGRLLSAIVLEPG